MKIPFAKPMIGDAEKHAVMSVLSRDRLTDGPEVDRFEHDFASMHGGHAVAVSSATAGLHLMFMAYGVRKLIVPALTHVATAHAAYAVGAEIRFADCEDDGNISDRTVEEARKDGFEDAHVCGMHYLGKPCMARMDFADSALMMGYEVKVPSVFSFYPTKHITTGEGGMIVVPERAMADRLRRLRAFGRTGFGKPNITEFGLNYRMTEMQAAIGIRQLYQLPEWLRVRRRNWEHLARRFAGPFRVLIAGDGPYALAVDLGTVERDNLPDFLLNAGVGTSIYYPIPVPKLTFYETLPGQQQREFPNAERIAKNVLCYPIGPHIGEAEIDYMARKTAEWLK